MTKDTHEYWRNALKGNFGPISEDHPQPGYYRKRGRSGWQRVAIWLDKGNLVARVDAGQDITDKVDISQIWLRCCEHPISYDRYQLVAGGAPWPDEPPENPGIGHNMPGDDPLQALLAELTGEIETTAEFLAKPIKTKEEADRAGIWARRVGDIAKRADDARKIEKEPHLAASRAVDDRWRGVIEDAKDLMQRLKRHVEPYLIAQKRAEEERARKAREEAERLRREAEKADEAQRAELARQAEDAEREAKAKNANAGRTGARVALRTEKRAKVTDYKAAALALLDANHAELREKIDQLAQRAVKAGIPLAGVEVEEVERAA